MEEYRGIVDILEAFPSVKLSPGVFLGPVAAHLQPRMYSISSSPLASPDHIHITVAIVRGEARPGTVHEGVCSNWLGQKRSSVASIFVRHTPFKLPSDPSLPVVMVGPGTGLAP